MQQKTGNSQGRQRTRRFKPSIMINAAKTKWHKPVRAAVPVKTSSGGRAHDMRNKLEWHTHRLECNSDFSAEMSTFCCPWTRWAHLDVTQTQELLFRATSDLWRPRIRRKSVVGDPLPSTGISHDSAWMFPCLIEPPINRLQYPFQCQRFWQVKTQAGQGCNSLLLCRPDVAA